MIDQFPYRPEFGFQSSTPSPLFSIDVFTPWAICVNVSILCERIVAILEFNVYNDRMILSLRNLCSPPGHRRQREKKKSSWRTT